MSPPNSTRALAKMKRAAGQLKAEAPHDVTIQLRLDKRQLAQLTEQAQQTGLSRSALIRAALAGVKVMRAVPTAEQREQYRQLMTLATSLNQLLVLGRLGKDLQGQVRATLEQVQQLLDQLRGKEAA